MENFIVQIAGEHPVLFLVITVAIVYYAEMRLKKNFLSWQWYKRRREKIYHKYLYAKKYIFTEHEGKFFRQLQEALKNEKILIFTQVDIKNIIGIKNVSEAYKVRQTLQGKHMDFVITSEQWEILCCIELDDSSHDTSDARRKDEMKDRYCAEVGIPLIRYRRQPYDFRQVHTIIQKKMQE